MTMAKQFAGFNLNANVMGSPLFVENIIFKSIKSSANFGRCKK